jgi:rhodanese-related sulfurtransferase
MTPVRPADLAALMGGAAPHAALDVRERAAYERGHIYWSTSLPRRLLETRLPGLITAKATPIVLIDADGAVADLARPTLAAMGYTDVRTLEGGLAAWRAAGRPLVQGLNVPSKVFGERALHEWKTPQVTCPELAERIKRGDDMVIVDSRTPEEYHRGCIPGSVSMPGGELVLRIGELVKRPDQTIVVHCGGRTRSYIGAESLRRMGLPNPIIALENGTMGWLLAGLELERGAERWAPPVTAKGRATAAEVAKRVAQADGLRGINAAELKACRRARARRTSTCSTCAPPRSTRRGTWPARCGPPGARPVQAIDDYLAVRGAQIVFVCDDGSRAALTTAWYQRLGFPKIAYLEGGVPAWQAAGGAMETGHPVPAPWGLEAARKDAATGGAGGSRGGRRDQRRSERRLRQGARAGRGLGLPEPARADDRRRRARQGPGDRRHRAPTARSRPSPRRR